MDFSESSKVWFHTKFLVAPILLYGSEVLGFEKNDNIEKVHLQFLKKNLGVGITTSIHLRPFVPFLCKLYVRLYILLDNFSDDTKYIPSYLTTNASLEKMSRMLSLCNVELLQKISIFIKCISGLFQ
jgi:hypothetical protein